MAITNAIIKAGAKGSTKAVEKIAEEAANKAVAKSVTRGLTGAGVSSLAPKAGSTLDGILGRSSGLVLPETKVAPISIASEAEKYFPGENISTIGGMINKFEGSTLDKIYKNKGLSKESYDTLKSGAREIADINNPIEQMNELGVSAKSNLPILNRQQYYEDTIGRLRRPDGSKNPYVSGKDVPDYMKNHLSNNTQVGNDKILREFFGDHDNSRDLGELYEMYENLAQGPNAREIYTPENIDAGVQLLGEEGAKAEQDFAERLFRGKKDISISGGSSPAKNVKVSRAVADAGLDTPVNEVATTTTNPALASEIASMKEEINSINSGAGMGGNRGGGTVTDMPGSEGFNVRLKNGGTVDVPIGKESSKATRQQIGMRRLDDRAAKALNANARQYRDLMEKSKSASNFYNTVAERARRENITLDNVADKTEAALTHIEDIKNEALAMAERNGVMLDLSGVEKAVGLSPTQKRKLAEVGLDLENDMLGGARIVTPTQAENIYKTLRDYAYKFGDSSDPATVMASKVLKKEANAISDAMNKTMDDLGIDFKASFLDGAGAGGVGMHPEYLKHIQGMKDFKFSDLRREESDWITIGKTAGNKIKEGQNINLFGIDTGIPNPITATADRAKGKYYERMASGEDNKINFTDAGGETGTLGGLLGKAKTAGLVSAGALGGLLLGGGGSGGSSSTPGSLSGYSYDPTAQNQDTMQDIDPYQTMTVGGYTYDELENGYMAALQAGDTDAAKLIANMIDMLDEKVSRYQEITKESADSSGIAAKQRAALNVLSGLMQNYSAQGPVGGRFTQFMNAITGGSYNPNTAAYDSGAKGSMGSIIKALGDTGALSEGDQKRALELLPNTQDSPQAAEMKYQQLVQILQGAGVQ